MSAHFIEHHHQRYTDPRFVDDEEIASLTDARKFIPDEIFKEVVRWVSIPTVDFIITCLRESKIQFLLAERAEEPFKDEWFIPGGRINWGETVKGALNRQVKRELDIVCPNPQFLDHLTVINPESPTRPTWVSIWHLYRLHFDSEPVINLNPEGKRYRWFSKIYPEWPDPVRAALQVAGFHNE